MFLLEILDLLRIFLLRLLQLTVPVFIELLVLLNVRLFAFLALLFVQIEKLFHLRAESLLFQLSDAVLS